MRGRKSSIHIEQQRLEEAKAQSNRRWDEYLQRLKTEKIDTEEAVRMMIEVNQIDYKILHLGKRDLLG